MEKAMGVVVSENNGTANVKIDRKGMCGDNCASCKSICGIKDTVVLARNNKGAKVGDKVSVSIPTTKGMLAMLITYGVPLLYSLFIAILMAVFLTEKLGALLLLSGIAAWFVVLWILEKKGIFFANFKTEITEILNKKEDTNEG